MNEKICYIVGAYRPKNIEISQTAGAYIMACDGGFGEMGDIKPDLVVGDFDSLGYIPTGYELLYHSPEKDDTDVLLAIKKGLELGFKTFIIYGCIGGRIDHAYANYQALGYLDCHGARGYLIGDGWVVTQISDSSIALKGEAGGVFSVFSPSGDTEGVCITGGKYPLEKYHMKSVFPIGVSNEFLEDQAVVTAGKGSLLIMWQCSPRRFFETM
ncbi:MAG: thiamine diphosphokinase [Clostridiaceae bacterium]|nr:thiamine diphosphokinase [Clostridiaceae bacterium]